jgi:4-hydroxy-tetrahydrodipicolinate synthase
MIDIIRLKGMGVAMVTPFDKDNNIDFDALKKLTEFLIDNKTDYLVVQGTTGESPVLSKEEKNKILATVIKINHGRLPIIYGIGGNNTAEIANEIANFNTEGVDAILSVSPFYSKPTQEGVFQHYKTISENSKLPIILYNVPGRTGSNVSAETTVRIAKACKNIVAIKEASGNFEQIMEIIQNKPRDFLVISGDDALTMPIIAAGGDGVISVVGNGFPKLFSDMVNAGLNGNTKESRELHYMILPIIKHLFSEGNPAGIKETLSHLKILSPYVRLPLMNVSEKTKNTIINITKSLY